MWKLGAWLVAFDALTFSLSTLAAEPGAVNESVTTASAQIEKKFGLYASIGNPYPTLFGVNAAYNLNKNLRASVGYGEVSVTTGITVNNDSVTQEKINAKTYAAGAEYLFLDSPMHGVVGLRAGYFDLSGKGDYSIDGFKSSTGYMYSNIGVDWVSQSGFELGGGANLAFLGVSRAGFYINSGWFF